MSKLHFDADIAIIGYGPTGVSAANFLAARGVKTIAIERAKDIYQRARAVTVNDWTMRCFQSVGLDTALTAGMDVSHSLRFMTPDRVVLRQIAFLPGNMGHAQSYAIYQPVMEQTLRDGAARYPEHAVQFGSEVTDVTQDEDGVTVTSTESETGKTSSLRVRYALACDGGSSKTRERLGIKLLGNTVDTRWVVIDAKVKRWWPDRHILTQWSDAQRPVVDIALANGNHRWELPLEPHESEDDFQNHEQLWRLLGTMGVTSEQVEIHQHAFYKHHIRNAESWRDHRVFLLGDAAHLMPPWAGQGMQSGIRDAYNLSWKLAEVLAGRLSAQALDSYQQEREPDVAHWTELSVFLGGIIKRDVSHEERAASPPPQEATGQAAMKVPALKAGWLTGKPSRKSAVGEMIPQPRVAASNGKFAMLDTLLGNGFVLLGDNLNPASLLTPAERTAWDCLNASYRAVLSPDQFSHDESDIIDIEGGLTSWMRQYGVRVIALRPDRFVAATDKTGLAVPGAAVDARGQLETA